MTARPILMSKPMVQAILAGTKLQTRRSLRKGTWFTEEHGVIRQASAGLACTGFAPVACPYGKVGDKLWVRESWMPDPPIDDTWASTQWAGCRDGKIAGVPERFRHPRFCNYAADWLHGQVRWTPSIHMPRWASRITLTLTEVRVQRLQDISEADAIAEGVTNSLHLPGGRFARENYAHLWDTINGEGAWDAAPCVWALTFTVEKR